MSKIKEIWCMHHSHMDIGYTHPQPLLLELQKDYIDQAIDLCKKTADYPEESRFRWTCEATYPLVRWLDTADEERICLLKQLIKEGRICVAALPMHTTPGCTAAEMIGMLGDLDQLRERLDARITTAINHDVNGQPWTLLPLMLDSGIDFYLTGINIHFGGIPFERPAAFRWQGADNRELLTFLGEHYSLFSQFFFTQEADTKRMHQGILNYVDHLEKKGYTRDFLFLTATNPPLYDNNCPDLQLADLIRSYNEEDHEFKIRFVTPEMLRGKLLSERLEQIPLHRGDWTDYWNFGCASTARETRVNRLAKHNIQKAEMIESFCGSPNKQYDSVKTESCNNALIYDEHTWGASQSITDPDGEETYSQLIHKVKTAYQSADLSAYLLSTQMERLAGNPHQSNEIEGIVIMNTSGTKQEVDLLVPEYYLVKDRHLSALRAKQYIPYLSQKEKTINFGQITMEPYSYKKIPFALLEQWRRDKEAAKRAYTIEDNELITPYYRVKFHKDTGRILQIHCVDNAWDMLDGESEWGFFEMVRETVDPRYHKQVRSSLFPRDVDLGNLSITQWNHEWKARRSGVDQVLNWHIEQEEDRVSFVWEYQAVGMESLQQLVTFSAWSPRIKLKVRMKKKPVQMPEAIYFTLPLQLKKDWQCIYDTASEYVRLDQDQLGTVCRDWVTVDKSVSMYDEENGVMLACPDAPMVQLGDFNFGRENKVIERRDNPLLLAWPLNNYWDTNFMADQSGAMEFNYELYPFQKLDLTQRYTESVAAEQPCVLGAAVDCKEEESGSIFMGEGKVMPIYMKPANRMEGQKKGFIVVLKNLTDETQEYTFRVPIYSSFLAEEVTVQEKPIRAIDVQNHKATLTVAPHALKLIRVQEMKQ